MPEDWTKWSNAKKYRAYQRAEKKAEKRRREAIRPGVVCSVCGKSYFAHKDYGEIVEHRKIAGKEQWIKV